MITTTEGPGIATRRMPSMTRSRDSTIEIHAERLKFFPICSIGSGSIFAFVDILSP